MKLDQSLACSLSLTLLHAVMRADAKWTESILVAIKDEPDEALYCAVLGARDGLGNTVLHHAAMLHPDIEHGIAEMLIKAGASIQWVNYVGANSLDVAYDETRRNLLSEIAAGFERPMLSPLGPSSSPSPA